MFSKSNSEENLKKFENYILYEGLGNAKGKVKPTVSFSTQIKYGLLYNTILVKGKVQGGGRPPKGTIYPFVNGYNNWQLISINKDGEVEFEYKSVRGKSEWSLINGTGKNTIQLVYRPIYDSWPFAPVGYEEKLADEYYGASLSDVQTYYSIPLIYPIVVLLVFSLITALIARNLTNTKKLREKAIADTEAKRKLREEA
ncbi:MAG: hypothetical protein LBS74_02515 [Oscillospiraceae bacterium]|nr:hypothetical protein [Oscillospiraceae bacterium]